MLQRFDEFLRIGFIILHPGLIERIHPQQHGRDSLGQLEEVDQLADVVLVHLLHRQHDHRHTALAVGLHHAGLGAAVDLLQHLAGKGCTGAGGDHEVALGALVLDHRLVEDLMALLQELSDGVQIPGEAQAGGECALAVLALGLAHQLL